MDTSYQVRSASLDKKRPSAGAPFSGSFDPCKCMPQYPSIGPMDLWRISMAPVSQQSYTGKCPGLSGMAYCTDTDSQDHAHLSQVDTNICARIVGRRCAQYAAQDIHTEQALLTTSIKQSSGLTKERGV